MDLPSGCMGLQLAHVVKPCAVGVDIRPSSWDVCILDVVKNKLNNYIPRCVFSGKLNDEDQVAEIMSHYSVTCGLLDSRPEATLAQRLQTRMRKKGIRLWRASYLTTHGDIKIQENSEEGILRLERTMTLDDVHYAFKTGAIALPQNFREISGGEFASELLSSTRVSFRTGGWEWWEWQEVGADHTFHAFNYALVAVYIGKLMHYGGDNFMGASKGIVDSVLPSSTKTIDPNVFEDDGAPLLDDEVMTWVA